MNQIYLIFFVLMCFGCICLINFFQLGSQSQNFRQNRILDASQSDNSSIYEEFLEFKWNYNKIYPTLQQEKNAFHNFVANSLYIKQRNIASNGSLILKINQFGDLDVITNKHIKRNQFADKREQIKQLKQQSLQSQNQRFQANNTRRLLVDCPNYQGCTQVDIPRNELPTSVNHSNKTGVVYEESPCYQGGASFANANLIEYLLYENSSWTNYRNLSKQEIYDCASNSTYMEFPQDVCQAGSGFAISPWWIFNSYNGNGIMYEEDYNVSWVGTPNATRCVNNMNSNVSHYMWLWDVNPGNHTQILNQLVYRPVAISFDGDQQDILFYSSGIISDGCDYELTPNSQLLIVGYDLTEGNEHYLLKNSWSDSYGDGGYLRIKVPSVDSNSTLGLCGINYNAETYSYYYTGLDNAW